MRQVLRDIGQFRVRPRRRALIAVPVMLGAIAGCTPGSGGTADEAGFAAMTQGPDVDSGACTDLIARVPRTVLSQDRITGPDDPVNVAAWGVDGTDPILLSCGVAPLGPTTDECIDVNDVSWVFREVAAGYLFTTYGRDPAVLVMVPSSVARSEATGALVDLNEAVAPLKQTERRCYDLADTEPSTDPGATAAPSDEPAPS